MPRPASIARAKARTRAYDVSTYGEGRVVYGREAKTRKNWLGALGEDGFADWLRMCGIGFEREQSRMDPDPDFTIGGETVELKTRSVHGTMRPSYVVHFPKGGEYDGCPALRAFIAYEQRPLGRLLVLGFITTDEWREKATVPKPGTMPARLKLTPCTVLPVTELVSAEDYRRTTAAPRA